MSDYSDVLYETRGHVATITLNRPERRNGLISAVHVNSKMARHDLEEGRDAFREKREPRWQGLKKKKSKNERN